MTAANPPIQTTIDVPTLTQTPVPTNDPPPPYPSGRTRRSRHARHSRIVHAQITSAASADSTQYSDHDALSPSSPFRSSQQFPTEDDGQDASETTPFLSPSSPTTARRGMNRQRSFSHTSTILSTTSAAPSLSHTLLSLFQGDDYDDDTGSEEVAEEEEGRMLLMSVEAPPNSRIQERSGGGGFLSKKAWKRYFRPMGKIAYYKSLFHLMVVNFPYALAAWVYLFVFTLTGTTLLMALPLGAALCFLDLLGARIFARGELALQVRFHSPLTLSPTYPLTPMPYPPRPIFSRYREPTLEEVEAGDGAVGMRVRETSFYKNAYAMFTDSTSYQALFYFLVIKPGITVVLTVLFLVLTPVSFILVFPAPFILRAARGLGVWQANIAVEGLYVAVR